MTEEQAMQDLYRVSLVGPVDGKPQKGRTAWLVFLHRDERRAASLGAVLARRLSVRTGHVVECHVEPLPLVSSEAEILAEADDVASAYPQAAEQIRVVLVASLGPATGIRAGSDLVDDLAGSEGVELTDWLDASDASDGLPAVSVPADDALRLLGDAATVARYGLHARPAVGAGPVRPETDLPFRRVSS
jgi:hypothetical protein